MLRDVARRLSAIVRPSDTLARIYGDEFVLLCEDLTDDTAAEGLLSRVRDAFTEPFEVRGASLTVAASVGVAFAGPGTRLSSQHLIEADHAMYEQKLARGRHRPDRLRDMASREEAALLTRDLARALLGDELALVHQPVVRLADGQITGVVSSPVWHRSDGALLDADQIFDLITDNGLFRQLFLWCRDRGVQETGSWPIPDDGRLDILITLPAAVIGHPDIVREIGEGCATAGLRPDQLVVMFTDIERFDVHHEASLPALESLRTSGARVGLTGFGSGAASLDSLHRLPLDVVQIDRSFLESPAIDDKGPAMLRGLTDLAHQLGLTVLIDGVDTHEARDASLEAGIVRGTGRYFSDPLTGDEMAILLSRPGEVVRLPTAPEPV